MTPQIGADESGVDDASEDAVAERVILLVEDNATIRRMLTMLLKREGYTVVSVPSAQGALDVLESGDEGTYDLLLTDLMMPGMSGSALAQRARERFGMERVLLMSGYADPQDDIVAGLPLLAKPFSPVEFTEAVASALKGG